VIGAPGLSEDIAALLGAALGERQFSGVACLVALDGELAVEVHLGTQATSDPDGQPLAPERQVPVTAATWFDLASVTKVFTAHTALSLADEDVVDLDAPVASALAAYRSGERSAVTLRHLLSHTSGLPATWDGWRAPLAAHLATIPDGTRLTATPLPDRDALLSDLVATPLEASPGARFEYSCVGYNTAMAYLEAVTGRPWRSLVTERTLGPLGLDEVTADPDPARCAATEHQPALHRGVVCGVVHDETAWSLGGGAGNAGLFATARGLLDFGEAVRRGAGRVRGAWMWDDALTPILGRPTTSPEGGFGSAMGLRIGDAAFMGVTTTARGHTGFTGTSLQVDRASESVIALLTNRVHPSRESSAIQPLRAAIADRVAAYRTEGR